MRPMKSVRKTSIILIIGYSIEAVLGVGCDQSFDPRASSDQYPVVYSFLATDRSDQFVRVYRTYPGLIDDPASNTNEYPVTGAIVTLSNGASTYLLADTQMTRPDTTRYRDSLWAYVAHGFTVENRGTYRLQVQLPSSEILAGSITVPPRPTVHMNRVELLSRPGDFPPDEKMGATASFGPGAAAYIFRLVVSFDVLEGNKWIRRRAEVPIGFRTESPQIEGAVYSGVTRLVSQSVSQVYTSSAYTFVLDHVSDETSPNKLIFNYVVLQFIQLDENLYNYYVIVRGFDDPFSLRLDKPNFSNIKNGTGLFASYSVDSLVQVLPYDFGYNRR